MKILTFDTFADYAEASVDKSDLCYIKDIDTWYQNDEVQPDPESGLKKGPKYAHHNQGLSAYDIACKNGFRGTVRDWMESLKPKPKPLPHERVIVNINNKCGSTGSTGSTGETGPTGDFYTKQEIDNLFAQYYKKIEINELLSNKQDKLTCSDFNTLVINGTEYKPYGTCGDDVEFELEPAHDDVDYTYELKVSPESLSINSGTTSTVTATFVTYADGVVKSTVNVTSLATWSSMNPNIATVNSGTVTGVSRGSTTITVTYREYSVLLNVSVKSVHTITYNLTGCSIDNRQTSVVNGGSYIGTISSNSGYNPITSNDVTVTIGGVAVSNFMAGNTITLNNISGDVVITAVATKSNVPVEGVVLNMHNHTLAVGENVQLLATVYPDSATIKNISWSSSNYNVASVAGGKVDAVSEGTATITVTTQDGGHTDTCEITVSNATPGTTYTVTTIGNISVVGPASVAEGAKFNGTVTANTGYDLGTVYVYMGADDITATAYNSSTHRITIASVTEDIQVHGETTPKTYTVTWTAGTGCTGNHSESAEYGTVVYASAGDQYVTVNNGYINPHWDKTQATVNGKVTFTRTATQESQSGYTMFAVMEPEDLTEFPDNPVIVTSNNSNFSGAEFVVTTDEDGDYLNLFVPAGTTLKSLYMPLKLDYVDLYKTGTTTHNGVDYDIYVANDYGASTRSIWVSGETINFKFN